MCVGGGGGGGGRIKIIIISHENSYWQQISIQPHTYLSSDGHSRSRQLFLTLSNGSVQLFNLSLVALDLFLSFFSLDVSVQNMLNGYRDGTNTVP